MIKEISNFKETQFILSVGKTVDKNLIKQLIEKIIKKQIEPFAKIYVFLHPVFLESFLLALKDKKIEIKGMHTDKTNFVLEL